MRRLVDEHGSGGDDPADDPIIVDATGKHDDGNEENDDVDDNDKQNLHWRRDGRGGMDDHENSSEHILVKWLATPGNWAVYRVAKADGKLALRTATSKMQHCQHISALIREAGCRVERTPKKIRCKIEYLEKQFWRAHEWAESDAAQQLLLSDPAKHQQRLRRKCPHYDALKNVMMEAVESAMAGGGTAAVAAAAAATAVAVGGDEFYDAAADDDVQVLSTTTTTTAAVAKRTLPQDDPALARLKRRREHLEVQKLEIDIKSAALQYQMGRLKEYYVLRRDVSNLYTADEIRHHVPALADLVKDGHFLAGTGAPAPQPRAP